MNNVINLHKDSDVTVCDLNTKLGVAQLMLAIMSVAMFQDGASMEEIEEMIDAVSKQALPILASASVVKLTASLPESSGNC